MTEHLHPALWREDVDQWIEMDALHRLCSDPSHAVILDERVADLHALPTTDALLVTAGEPLKSFSALEKMCGFLLESVSRGARTVLAVGGGTVGDSAGLAAHLVRRGMPLHHVPSTLLAAVDSSLGGKTAINAPDGTKNAIGAFHFPGKSYLAVGLWETLTTEQLTEGRAEAVKMALCLDAELADSWKHAIADPEESVRHGRKLKREICSTDPYDCSGRRAVLNFGHTVGHALESISNFAVSHGLAVAAGMHAALDVGLRAGVTSEKVKNKAERILEANRLPGKDLLTASLSGSDWEQFRSLLKGDKKGYLRFVLLEELGRARVMDLQEQVLRSCFDGWKS